MHPALAVLMALVGLFHLVVVQSPHCLFPKTLSFLGGVLFALGLVGLLTHLL